MSQEVSNSRLILIAAPSGAGKTSLVSALTERNSEHLKVSVSCTTRPQRDGEIEGESYYFIAKEQFQELIEKNHFLEYASVFDNLYGTSQDWVEKTLNDNKHVILEIDWQGAEQIRQKFSNNISIFILPPSYEILEERLRGRGNDPEDVIAHRMHAALDEISHFEEFDQVIINDDFEDALHELEEIIKKGPKDSLVPEHFSDFVGKLIEQGSSRKR